MVGLLRSILLYLLDFLKSSWLGWIILFFLLGHIWIGFEREGSWISTSYYFNEFLSLCGLLTLIQNSPLFLSKNDIVIKSVLFLLGYGLIYSIYSFFFLQDNFYGFLRNLPLWYSIFCFFLGSSLWKIYLDFKSHLTPLISWGLALLPVILLQGTRSTPVYILFVKSLRAYDWSILLLLYLISGDSTSKMVFLSYLIFILIRASFIRLLYPHVILIGILCCILFLNWSYHEFSDFYHSGSVMAFAEGNGQIDLIWKTGEKTDVLDQFKKNMEDSSDQSNKILNIQGCCGNYNIVSEKLKITDSNALWRLMFWSYSWKHNISTSPLLGIGFGTPLFDLEQETWFIWVTNIAKDANFPYTLGMHNSFIYVLTRLGLIGFVPLLCIYFWLYRVFLEHPILQTHREVTVLFMGFIFMTVNAFFNVVLESPRYAGIYWAVLGLLYQSIQYYYPRKTYGIFPTSNVATNI
ncbi:MAG: hypothetical protein HQM12_20215 [SAR324 cluster bacterium]|nr:hypothetical protein [SAR324 cluster bacterium]